MSGPIVERGEQFFVYSSEGDTERLTVIRTRLRFVGLSQGASETPARISYEFDDGLQAIVVSRDRFQHPASGIVYFRPPG